ncbi:MAG: hypothetical protein AB7F22_05170 [Reyranella sp.]|uniref:hypothetical protein n=1 Tax=Reyranella sp. TaxID=1929291 RepID=UPI003D152EF7
MTLRRYWSISELQALAERKTHDVRRAEAMGFVFHRVKVEPVPFNPRDVELRGYFRCVCGTEEAFRFIVPHEILTCSDENLVHHEFDVGARLRRHGSFSRKHLLDDGYPPAQVDEMMAKTDAFNRAGW